MMRRILAAAAVAAVLVTIAPTDGQAATLVVCRPQPAGAAPGPSTVTNPNTTNRYTLNAAGCAPMRNDDAAFFLTRGFTQGPNIYQLFFSQQSTGFKFTLPLSAFLKNMVFSEVTGNAVTNGICIGTTNAGVNANDVATMVGTASTLKAVTDSSMAKRVFSISAGQTIFVNACDATGFGSSKWDVSVEYGYF